MNGLKRKNYITSVKPRSDYGAGSRVTETDIAKSSVGVSVLVEVAAIW